MVRKKKEFRELKVSSFSGYGYKTAPMLRLQGLWVEQWGFNNGDPILVKPEDGKLTITLDEETAFIEEKKQAFLDAEMQKLEKKYEAEKKNLYRQMVAEREARYEAWWQR